MAEQNKKYKEPQTNIEILNAQLRIAKWAAQRILELENRLQETYERPIERKIIKPRTKRR